MAVTVTPSRCPQNHPCPAIRACPAGALTQDGFSAPRVDATKCTDCGICTQFCGFGALLSDRTRAGLARGR
jgi:ferredoxin